MHPIFARLHHRLDRVKAEADRVEAAVRLFAGLPETDAVAWSRKASTAFGIEGVYTGIETILKTIAGEIDGYVPTGEDWHAKLLEAMALPIDGLRPPVLSATTHAMLNELRKFRHVARSNYGIDLTDSGVAENLDRMRTAVPAVERDLRAFEAWVAADTDRR